MTLVIGTLALALASTSVTHLTLSQHSANGEVAKNMAESVVSAALEKVLEDENFGASRSNDALLTLDGAEPGTSGRLTFNKELAKEWQVDYSTNNLEFEGARAGAGGRVVPGTSLHLVGLGECNGVRREVEAIFHIPKFPYVVATSGRFETEGETLIASIDSFDQLTQVLISNLDALRPGDVVANSNSADALTLGAKTTITGDAKAVGGIELESGARILGQVRPNSSAETIPHYSVPDFDPDFTGKLGVTHINQDAVGTVSYEGWTRREGDLTITGGLELDNGVLFVNGNLTVSGGVTGTGALFVNGNTVITGKSALNTDNLAAIVSEGDVTLSGPTSQNSVFRGLVYSNKSLVAENMTLVGTLLIAGDNNDLKLKDSRVIYSPDSVKVDLRHSARTALHFVSPSGGSPGAYLGTKGSDHSLKNKKRIYISFAPSGDFLIYPEGSTEEEGLTASTVSEAVEAIKGLLGGDSEDVLQAFDSTAIPKLPDLLTGLKDGTVPFEEEQLDLVNLDPAHFLSLSDKIRLILMREI